MPSQKIIDHAERTVAVGVRVRVDGKIGTVRGISDYDVDYSDEAQRAVMFPPKITVAFDRQPLQEIAETFDVTKVTWADYPDGPSVYTFMAEGLEVVSDD